MASAVAGGHRPPAFGPLGSSKRRIKFRAPQQAFSGRVRGPECPSGLAGAGPLCSVCRLGPSVGTPPLVRACRLSPCPVPPSWSCSRRVSWEPCSSPSGRESGGIPLLFPSVALGGREVVGRWVATSVEKSTSARQPNDLRWSELMGCC